jgi:hypothetical protein
MELADLPIPSEEYPFMALGVMWLNWACILVMEWGEDEVICLKTVRHAISLGT